MSRQKKVFGFIAISIAMFMGTLDSTIVNIALPDITNYFHSNLDDTSWISTIYVMGLAVFMITASKLADQFGRKKVMSIGLVLFGASSAMCGFAHSLLFLIAMRLIQGIGGAIITPIAIPMGLEIFGKEKIQQVGGIVGAVTALAAAGGPPVGGIIIEYLNWQTIFFVNVPLTLISLLLMILFTDESYDQSVSRSIDWVGMLSLTAALFLLTFALLKGNDYGWQSVLILSMFIDSAVSLAVFIFVETKAKAPMLELGLLREPTFTSSSLCYLITGLGMTGPVLLFNYFLQNVLNYTALNAAFIVMTVSLTIMVSMPLGTVIAGKFGSKPVNVLGILIMGLGLFLLSRLTVSTPRFTMIADMVVNGIGFGFACQSVISSIKYLPKEKSGIGSGVVNAARQIGTCIGIALLVSILDTNIAGAKTDVKNYAVSQVNGSGLADTVKATAISDIQTVFSNTDNTKNKALQDKLENDLEHSITALASSPKPSGSSVLEKLYDGASSLSDGAGKAAEGQKSLNSGLSSLSSGLNKLSDGDNSLTSGLETLDSGLSQAVSGAQTLNSSSSQGIGALTSGIGQLNSGAQQMLSQFLSGGTGGTTVYDGVTGVADGAQSLSSNLSSYVSAVNNTYYLMIKNDPSSPQLLQSCKTSLAQAQAAYTSAAGTARDQLKEQVAALANLVALYAAGTDASVTNEAQFEAKLTALAGQSAASQNVVAGGSQITSGASQLSSASQEVASQFKEGGAFKSGMEELASGTEKLSESTGSISSLQQGIHNLLNGLLQLRSGSDQLLTGSKALQSGITSAKSGSDQLQSGSGQLMEADAKIQSGASQLAAGIGSAGQAGEAQTVLNKVLAEKDRRFADAFDRVFLLAAIILVVSSVCGFFTDRKRGSCKAEREIPENDE